MSKLNKLANQAKKAKPASFSEDAIRNFTQKIEETGVVETVATAKIKLNPANDYRERDNDESINSLAEDISRQGLLHNLVVSEKTENGEKTYLLISGERRLRAIRLLIERETEKVKNGQNGDPGRYQTVNCRVVRGLTDRQEMIMLDAANLQTRGGAGDEAATRKAMVRYRENVMAEYGLTAAQVRDIIVDMSPVGFTTVNSNLLIEDNLRAELRNMLDSNEISKKQALGFVKLSQEQQKRVSDAILTLKDTFAKNGENFSDEVKTAVKGFFEATEEKTEKKAEERLQQTEAEIAAKLQQLKAEKAPEARVTVKKAQRDIMLADCEVIRNKIAKLSTTKAVANIRRFDAAAEEESLKISAKIDGIIAQLQQLKNALEGEE
ncbi:MAG: ParB N-terminal domain-containing protein [Oscillospiraceae bacterium]|nr:ParB N-terminal domain-containing protein [Oscillospiraceae bacterium]